MKNSLFALILAGAACALPSQTILADDGSTVGQTAPSSGSTNSGGNNAPAAAPGERFQRFKEAMAQLDLTDAQKAQIKQIRATVTDRTARRQQILALLTPEQKSRLSQLLLARRSGAQSGDDTPVAPGAN